MSNVLTLGHRSTWPHTRRSLWSPRKVLKLQWTPQKYKKKKDCAFGLESAVGILTSTTGLADFSNGTYWNINTARFDERFKIRLRAYFFQNSCHYMILIYKVIKPRLTSNRQIPHVPKQFRKEGYANLTTHQIRGVLEYVIFTDLTLIEVSLRCK